MTSQRQIPAGSRESKRTAFARHSLITICICLIGRYQTGSGLGAVRAVVESRRQIKIYQPRHKSRMKSRQLHLIRPLIYLHHLLYSLLSPSPRLRLPSDQSLAASPLPSRCRPPLDSPHPRLSRQNSSPSFCSRKSTTKTSLYGEREFRYAMAL